jgi:hypothetical protein
MKILFWVVLFTQAGWWPETGNAQDFRRVRISYSSRSNSTTVYQVALAKGIFKEEGLEVQMIQMNPRLGGLAVMNDIDFTTIWRHIARNRPWLEAFTSSTMLERRNNGEIIRGGGLSARIAKRWVEDLGVSIDKAPSLKVHSVADVEHADMMWEVFERHAQTDKAQRGVLSAAHEWMGIDRAYRGALADAMLAIA